MVNKVFLCWLSRLILCQSENKMDVEGGCWIGKGCLNSFFFVFLFCCFCFRTEKRIGLFSFSPIGDLKTKRFLFYLKKKLRKLFSKSGFAITKPKSHGQHVYRPSTNYQLKRATLCSFLSESKKKKRSLFKSLHASAALVSGTFIQVSRLNLAKFGWFRRRIFCMSLL